MKIIKRWMLLFIGLVLLITLVGCSTAKEVSYEDDLEDDSPLRLYATDSNYFFHFTLYNNQKPKDSRKLEVTKFDWHNEKATMYQQILDEMAVGEGPDIIFIDKDAHQYMDIHKIAKQNAFADMDILIERDGEFDLADYHALAMDTGIVDGKRVMIPAAYEVQYMMGIKECFENNGLTVPKKLTMDAYLGLLESYYSTQPQEPALLGIDPIYLLAEYIHVGEPVEDTSELRRLFEVLKEEDRRLNQVSAMYRDEVASIIKHFRERPKDMGYSSLIDYTALFFDKNLLFRKPSSLGQRNIFYRLHENYNVINHAGGEMVTMDQPVKDGSPYKAYVEDYYLINSNSKHKNEAFDFIKHMLSEQVLHAILASPCIPVGIKEYEYVKKNMDQGYYMFDALSAKVLSKKTPLDEEQVPPDLRETIVNYVERVEACENVGRLRYVYHNVINQSVEGYFKDFLTYEEMLEEINNKMRIYYSE